MENFLEKIQKEIKMISFWKIKTDEQIIYQEAYNEAIKKVWDIINKHKQ